MQILVIDDDPDLLDNVNTILKLSGYEVLRADNGVDGLRLIHDYHPDLIICDIMMPEVSGYDVLEELQANSKTAPIPLIFLTAKTQMHDIRRGMQAGADDYLIKPFTEEDLLTAIQTRLEKRRRWELQQHIAFSHDLVQTQEHELQRIARELDQSLRQKLLNIKFFMDTQLAPAQTDGVLGQVQRSLDELLTQVTTLSYSLYPVMLSHMGLIPTLQWYLNTCQQRLNVRVKLDTYNMPGRLADATELVLYRITRRVMQNVTTAAQDIDAVLWYDENAVHYSISPLPLFDRTQGWRLLPLLEEYGHTIGANLGMQSEENSATVYLTIPDAVFQSSEAHLPPLAVQTKPNVEASVLVISPDSAFLDHVTKMLVGLVRVIAFQTDNPDELPQQLQIHAPQILVLDLVIPSDELSVVIRETNVILLSPYPDETFARQALRQGVMGFVPRARAHTELLSAVQTVLHHERYISAALLLGGDEAQSTKPLNLDVLLTRREREVMELILQDKTHADIAAQLVISPRTVEKHRANMMQKLALDTHTELILFAMRYGLMPPG